MSRHIERLMSRASVAAMAAFAKEPASTVPAFAERVDADSPTDGGGEVDAIDGLTPEEQAGLDAMRQGAAPEPAGGDDDGPAADGDSDGAADGDGDGDAAGDRDPAPPADGQPAPRTPKTINYGRHQKELAKLTKERDDALALLDGSRKETAKEREERLRLDERSRLLLEAINTKAPPAAAAPAAVDDDPEPDKDGDPIGHSEWKIRKLEKIVTDLQSGQQRQQQTAETENEETRTYGALIADINRVVNGDPVRQIPPDPTMTDAFVHLRETRYQELGFIFAGIDINNPEECAKLSEQDQAKLSDNIQRTFHNEQMLVAREALGKRQSPAAVIRNLARARGWKPSAPAPAAVPGAQPAPPAGGAAPAAPRAPAAPAPQGSVKDQLGAVRDNLEASRSLSDAGGSPGGQMTPQRLAEMSEAEFEEFYNSMPKNKLDALMGKPANM